MARLVDWVVIGDTTLIVPPNWDDYTPGQRLEWVMFYIDTPRKQKLRDIARIKGGWK